jgi:hypothetical protein
MTRTVPIMTVPVPLHIAVSLPAPGLARMTVVGKSNKSQFAAPHLAKVFAFRRIPPKGNSTIRSRHRPATY